MPLTRDQIIEALRPVEDPEIHRSIVELGMVRSIDPAADGSVAVLIALTVPGCPLKNEITNRVTAAVAALDGVTTVAVEFTVMSDRTARRCASSCRAAGTATATRTGSRRATPRAGRSRSPSPARAPARCSSRPARAASASRA